MSDKADFYPLSQPTIGGAGGEQVMALRQGAFVK